MSDELRKAAAEIDRMAERMAEARELLKEWMAEPASFDDERINYVEKQIGRALIRDTANFLKRTSWSR